MAPLSIFAQPNDMRRMIGEGVERGSRVAKRCGPPKWAYRKTNRSVSVTARAGTVM